MTGDSVDAAALVRFVVDPDGVVVPDVAGKLPGRGLWVTAERAAVDTAVAKNLFSRAARRAVRAEPDLADRTEMALLRLCGGTLGIARRAGAVVSGFDAVAGALAARRVGVWIVAADASDDGRAKLAGKARGLAAVDWLTRDELSLALGRENVVHAAVAPGGFGDRFARDAGRLRGFRGSAQGAVAGASVTLDSKARTRAGR